ncbi:hypothetical protein [Streptomyces resistomycificus]|uniref:Uncharacterized protein n=1 Tax=Streptomyces resistomycificus TaxID=67356 RepID=A0A0L8L0S5_9ACTN|nr:hypothetical protein [Streptomyces resistomycificus]KOG31777.1 hypothetical protein ADK37_29745 [Streptomyces resistomycificus]KUN95614.1 hypothetical protein AQJ84_22700 [Streptomyces resistomycificus]
MVSVSSARNDYDDRTAEYGRHAIPVNLADGRISTLDLDKRRPLPVHDHVAGAPTRPHVRNGRAGILIRLAP